MGKWDKRFMQLAGEVAKWSKDPNRKVGAVIVKNNRIISTGFNGFPAHFDIETDNKNPYVIHAEVNAIADAKVPLDGATIYVSGLHPCSQCAALIVQCGIKRVVYDYDPGVNSKWSASIKAAKEIFEGSGVQVEKSLPFIILVGGKKRSGKNWVASQLGVPVFSFAQPAKEMFKVMFGVEFDAAKSQMITELTGRQLMQRFATDAMQAQFGVDVWVKLLLEKLQFSGHKCIAVSDWRFKAEAIPGALKVYVTREDAETDEHLSENSIGPDDADIVLDNTSNCLTKEKLTSIFNIINNGF